MDLDTAADELYALAPDELDNFASRRAELAAQAKSDGDRALAGQITKLRKPVQAAALVNLLVRSQPAALAELTELAGELRNAHRHLRGTELRKLSERRQQMLGKLVALARKAARRSVTDSVLEQLRATFEAAIADEAAEQAVLSGRLTTGLSYSGFGAVDIGDAVAVPRRLTVVPDLPTGKSGTKAGEKQSDGERSEGERVAEDADREAARRPAERELARAERTHTEALDSLDSAVEELDAARARAGELAERIQQLEQQLTAARKDAGRAAKETEAAEREHRRAARAVERSERAVASAQADLDELS
jgi:flagellin-like hook-associated protein FlgL